MQLMMPLRRFSAGELVFSQAQPVTALFILKEGRIRIFHVTEGGKAMTMALLEPWAVFGEMALVGQQMYDNYAEAVEDSAVCRLDSQDVEQYLLSDPRIAAKVAMYLGEQVLSLEERLLDLATRPLAVRVAKTAVTLADAAPAPRFGQAASVRLTHEQLAGILGVTREATSRIMAEFAANDMIRQSRGKITIRDADALRAIARKT
ncbi:CRP/FNR family transcriptional regulator [Arthrobacter sp. CAN_A6]|uniref:Crp/Fnr family transcriptional regulator n=1 Tax=Arthrobacter sp. CAN_A6 TaxID=2787721 RepID=UPI0018CB429A